MKYKRVALEIDVRNLRNDGRRSKRLHIFFLSTFFRANMLTLCRTLYNHFPLHFLISDLRLRGFFYRIERLAEIGYFRISNFLFPPFVVIEGASDTMFLQIGTHEYFTDMLPV